MRTMLKRLVLLFCLAPLLITAAHAQSVLYDGSGGLKMSEYGGWTTFVPPPASETFLAGATLLNTTSANALQAGFSRSPSSWTPRRTTAPMAQIVPVSR